MFPPLLIHSAVPAHAARIRELTTHYDAMAQALRTGGVDSEPLRASYTALTRCVAAWQNADRAAEYADLVHITAAERSALQRRITDLLPYAAMYAEGQAEPLCHLERQLAQRNAELPTTFPRAVLVKLQRCLDRFDRLQQLQGPTIILCGEAKLVNQVLDWQNPPEIMPLGFFPERGFATAIEWALETCTVREPGKPGSVDLGLGQQVIRARCLGVTLESLDDLDERWRATADPAHPWARYPFVPRRRFAANDVRPALCGDLQETGPVGWACDEDLVQLATQLDELTASEPEIKEELRAVANRYRAAHAQGQAVVAWLQYSPSEAEGQRIWLVDSAEG